ncbi:hypothetical protein ACWER9_06415 [Micromonospora sp. NPDC003944]
MPTPAQLQAESYWTREIVTDEIDWLGDELCRRTKRPRTAFGSKGNTAHLRGAHRSQEWIKRSRYCTNRTYTVQSGLTAEQERHVAGVDFTPGDWGTARNRALMVEQTGRLLAAMKAGQLDEVIELFGTTNGRTVTGYNNRTNQAASSDDSHLDHWHLTIDRRHCRNRKLMERILAIALGLPVEGDDDMSERASRVIEAWASGVTATSAKENVEPVKWRIRDEAWQAKTDATLAAVLAAAKGLDTKAVLARINEVAAAESARDAELVELVRQAKSGELDADQFVDEVARRLSGQASE